MRTTGRISPDTLNTPGTFVVGCNYWASHAGTAMWRDWRPAVVAQDLRQLAANGIQVLRMFPLWPDFQPLTQHYTGHGRPAELRLGEEPLPPDEVGQAGVSADALAKFGVFADLAAQHGLKLVVGLVTGWMSGRLFVPPAFAGRNVLADPLVLMWTARYVRCFVRRFRTHPAVLAWDLGNECNCMAPVPHREAAWLWTATVANAIRLEDTTRPIVSGMHSLEMRRESPWTMQDQAELTDVLTTHPYPIFTPHCDQDPVNTLRPCLHATAESRLYADVGGQPCLVEEIGTLGPMICSEKVAADYIRTVLFSSWAHDCHGLFWWCAFDQLHLEHAPYDWHAYERELGLIRQDRTAKPALRELHKFSDFVRGLPFRALPPRLTEAVCILTEGQDQWAAAYSSFILAKQAGFDLQFQYSDQPLRDSALYLLPGLSGAQGFSRRFWLQMLDRVRAGATLYLSHNDCSLAPFTEPFGLEVVSRERRVGPAEIQFGGLAGAPALRSGGPFRLNLEPCGAEVLGAEPDGNPAFTCTRLGRGRIYFLTVPLELELARTPGAFAGPQAQDCWRIYRHFAEPCLRRRVVRVESPVVGVTEHPLDRGSRVAVLINHGPQPVSVEVTLARGWAVTRALHGALPRRDGERLVTRLARNDAAVWMLKKRV